MSRVCQSSTLYVCYLDTLLYLFKCLEIVSFVCRVVVCGVVW